MDSAAGHNDLPSVHRYQRGTPVDLVEFHRTMTCTLDSPGAHEAKQGQESWQAALRALGRSCR
jgi:hypothetical protein